jgi:hypothetical protein
MPLPAFLVPALTSFALAKLTGASTKSALKGALIGGLTGGIADKLTTPATAANAANQVRTATQAANIASMGADPGTAAGIVGTNAIPQGGIVTAGIESAKQGLKKPLFDMFGKTVTGGDALKYGLPAAAIYKSYADAAKAPKETMFYGANLAYANPDIYSQVGPTSFKVGQYDDAGQMTTTGIEGAEDYVPPEEVYARGDQAPMPYAVGKQLISASTGGLATLKGIQKYNAGGQVLPSKMNYDENDANNYVRANGHVVDMSDLADKDEDTVLAQLADGEFVTRADGVLGAGILAGANPGNMEEMRKKGAKYFYEQQAKYKRIFDLLRKKKQEAN